MGETGYLNAKTVELSAARWRWANEVLCQKGVSHDVAITTGSVRLGDGCAADLRVGGRDAGRASDRRAATGTNH